MKKVFVGLALLFIACAAPGPPSTPAPLREVPAVRVSGAVVASDGHRVRGANVMAGAASSDCRFPEHAIGGVSDESGQFSLTIERGASSRCVVVRATSGGVSGEASVPATFGVPADAVPPVDFTVRLNRPAPLTASEAERLVHLLATAVNNTAAPVDELSLNIAQGGEALRVAIELHRQLLGRVAGVDEVAPSAERSPSYEHHTFVLRGERRHTFTWRLRGAGTDGRELTEDVVLRVGDGLVGVEGL